MGERPDGGGDRKRKPLYADPDLPTSVDIINAYTGGGAAIRRRLAEPPRGVSLVPITLAVLFVFVGGWLTASAGATTRLALDDVPVFDAASPGADVVLPVSEVDRSLVIGVVEERVAGDGVGPIERAPARAAGSFEQRINDQLSVTTRLRVRDASHPDDPAALRPPADERSCRWLPSMTTGRTRLTEIVCARVPAGARVLVAADPPSRTVVVDAASVPTRVDASYLVQGLVPLVIGAALFGVHAALVLRDRRQQRRYEAVLARQGAWPFGPSTISLN